MKNNEDIAKEFFKLCRITKKAVNFEIYLREKIKNSKKTNIPDITFEWEDDGSNIFVEAKLDSPVDKSQLNRYLSKGKVICITRAGEELEVRKKVKGVTFKTQKMLMVKYFLGYLTYLGISTK